MTDRTLIEDELPLAEINKESARDKSLRHGHISTMHLWWAPRPLPMSRAIVFASLVVSPNDETERKQLLEDLANAMPFDRSLASQPLDHLRQRIREAWPEAKPKVLDCFAGRGIIPMEALRLGCDVYSVDLNPVAHLIQRAIVEFPQRWNDLLPDGRYRLVADFLLWSARVREIAESRLNSLFPSEPDEMPAIYFWARTMKCSEPTCRRTIPLIKSRKLADSPNRKVRVDFEIHPDRTALCVEQGEPQDGTDWDGGTVRASSVTCPACDTTHSSAEVRKYAQHVGFDSTLFAVMSTSSSKGKGRTFRAPTAVEKAAATLDASALEVLAECPDGTSSVPDELMVKSQYRRFANLTYGIDSWSGLFTTRQLMVLGTLCEAVRQAHSEMLAQDDDPDRAAAITTYLAFVVDRIADYDSSFCTWVPGGEFVRLSRPAWIFGDGHRLVGYAATSSFVA